MDSVYAALNNAGFKVDVMHADRPQGARTRALTKFRNGTIQVLVATDVMSRGIDVRGIDAVVNFDVPLDPEDYVHRIGRTGRAGSAGQAFTFMAPDEITPLREIEYFTKSLIAAWDLPNFGYKEGRIVLLQNLYAPCSQVQKHADAALAVATEGTFSLPVSYRIRHTRNIVKI